MRGRNQRGGGGGGLQPLILYHAVLELTYKLALKDDHCHTLLTKHYIKYLFMITVQTVMQLFVRALSVTKHISIKFGNYYRYLSLGQI